MTVRRRSAAGLSKDDLDRTLRANSSVRYADMIHMGRPGGRFRRSQLIQSGATNA
jgi:hypothetical protein